MPSATSTDPIPIARTPSSMAPVPRRATRAARMPTPTSTRSEGQNLRITTHPSGLRARRRGRPRPAAPPRAGVEPGAQVGARLPFEVRPLRARGADPAPQPLLRQLAAPPARPARHREATGWAGSAPPRAPGGTRRRRRHPRPAQAAACRPRTAVDGSRRRREPRHRADRRERSRRARPPSASAARRHPAFDARPGEPSTSWAVSRSSTADAVTSDVPASSDARRWVRSPCCVARADGARPRPRPACRRPPGRVAQYRGRAGSSAAAGQPSGEPAPSSRCHSLGLDHRRRAGPSTGRQMRATASTSSGARAEASAPSATPSQSGAHTASRARSAWRPMEPQYFGQAS